MSWQTDKLAEQAEADALFTMGDAEWRETYEDGLEPMDTKTLHVFCPHCKKDFLLNVTIAGYKGDRLQRRKNGKNHHI